MSVRAKDPYPGVEQREGAPVITNRNRTPGALPTAFGHVGVYAPQCHTPKRGFQKSLAVRLEDPGEAQPGSEVEVRAEDEARLGLKRAMRRVWAPAGERPVARLKRGHAWTHLCGFVHPRSGRVFWLVLHSRSPPRKWEPERGSASCWWWTRPGGTREVEVPERIHL